METSQLQSALDQYAVYACEGCSPWRLTWWGTRVLGGAIRKLSEREFALLHRPLGLSDTDWRELEEAFDAFSFGDTIARDVALRLRIGALQGVVLRVTVETHSDLLARVLGAFDACAERLVAARSQGERSGSCEGEVGQILWDLTHSHAFMRVAPCHRAQLFGIIWALLNLLKDRESTGSYDRWYKMLTPFLVYFRVAPGGDEPVGAWGLDRVWRLPFLYLAPPDPFAYWIDRYRKYRCVFQGDGY